MVWRTFKTFDSTLSGGAINSCIGNFNARFVLVAVGHLLPDSDHLHGQEVLVDAPAIQAANGVFLHTQQQLGSGSSPAGMAALLAA